MPYVPSKNSGLNSITSFPSASEQFYCPLRILILDFLIFQKAFVEKQNFEKFILNLFFIFFCFLEAVTENEPIPNLRPQGRGPNQNLLIQLGTNSCYYIVGGDCWFEPGPAGGQEGCS